MAVAAATAAYFRVEDHHPKGRMLVATREIPRGQLIHSESPICVARYSTQPPNNPNTRSSQNAVPQFANLQQVLHEVNTDPARLTKFIQLRPKPKPTGPSVATNPANNVDLDNIFKTNAFTLVDHLGNRTSKAAVYETLALINHSCLPNAEFYGTHATHRLQCIGHLRARRDIRANEEITVMYFEDAEWDSTKNRRSKLKRDYGFHCMCEVCDEKECHHTCRAGSRDDLRDLKKLLDGYDPAGSHMQRMRQWAMDYCELIEYELGNPSDRMFGAEQPSKYRLPVNVDPRLSSA